MLSYQHWIASVPRFYDFDMPKSTHMKRTLQKIKSNVTSFHFALVLTLAPLPLSTTHVYQSSSNKFNEIIQPRPIWQANSPKNKTQQSQACAHTHFIWILIHFILIYVSSVRSSLSREYAHFDVAHTHTLSWTANFLMHIRKVRERERGKAAQNTLELQQIRCLLERC